MLEERLLFLTHVRSYDPLLCSVAAITVTLCTLWTRAVGDAVSQGLSVKMIECVTFLLFYYSKIFQTFWKSRLCLQVPRKAQFYYIVH